MLAYRRNLARIGRIGTTSYVKNVFEALTVVAGHGDDGFDDTVARAEELGSVRQNVSALALVIFAAKYH